jgi:hypothetical protein
VKLGFANLSACEVSYFPMDLELSFSANPFVQQESSGFAYIRPRRTDALALPADRDELAFDLPDELQGSNVLVEVRAGALVRRKPCLQGRLRVQWMSAFGQIAVSQEATGKPLPKVYVKVYARRSDGSVVFHKDGYPDLRGRFDYATVSGGDANGVQRYAVLVSSDTDGASIGEVEPPAR